MNKKLFLKRSKEALKAYSKEDLQDIDFNNPTIETLELIADMGEVSVDWLLGRDEKNPVKLALLDSKVCRETDELTGNEIIRFGNWLRNYYQGEISEEVIDSLYPDFVRGKRISSKEKELLLTIYKSVIVEVLCKNKG